MSAQWSKEQTCMLIDKCKNGNEEYHRISNRDKRNFWEKIVENINQANNTNYFTGEDSGSGHLPNQIS
ncbi:17273_t:CDS:2 [Funneliformis caledonium]|uniref:17273_t:CDS:1 n=1 Tax=Funneliformis caledonium TaxID=1117310 RepID=A0A9N8WI49_9GLOM|nr:17273_t:CDS:2 [Funneliformis caledonium]